MQDYLVILHTILGVDVFASIRDIGEPAVAGSLDQHIVAKASKQVFGLIHDSSGRGLIRKLLCVIRYIVIIGNYRLRSTEILDKSKRKWIPYRKKLFVLALMFYKSSCLRLYITYYFIVWQKGFSKVVWSTSAVQDILFMHHRINLFARLCIDVSVDLPIALFGHHMCRIGQTKKVLVFGGDKSSLWDF